MRVMMIALVAMVGACASGGGDRDASTGPSPFPVERGTAERPPAQSSGFATPPEGPAAGGLDFGRWRQADPATYAPQFQAQVRERFEGQNAIELRASLEANGFRCEDERRLDCRIEIMERQCAFDWYVVLERGVREPVAGFEQMCLGANR